MSQPRQPNAPAGAVTIRENLEGTEITAQGDMSPTYAAAEARAEVETRILSAKKWPRSIETFRERILVDCKRPGFAAAALYRKPVGRKKNEQGQWEQQYAINFSIRFMESALQHFTNTFTHYREVYEDERIAKILVAVFDAERITGYSAEAIIEKTVERKRDSIKGRVVREQRLNSYGDEVLVVDATKDEVRNLKGAERSKLIRDWGRRLMPFDILEEARAQIDQTLENEHAKDPEAAKKQILDAFLSMGVRAEQLREYLEMPLDQLTPKDLAELRGIYSGLKDGDFSWADLVRLKTTEAEGEADPKASASNPIKEKLRERTQKKTETPEEPPK